MNKTHQSETISSLQSHTGFWLRFVSNHVSQAFARKLVASDVTVAEWVILREMYGRADIAPSDLADITGLTRGAISKLVDRLTAKRLISRRHRDDDRRYQTIALTAAGTRLVPTLAAIADQNDEDFFSALSPREREALVTTLKKIVQAHSLHKLPIE